MNVSITDQTISQPNTMTSAQPRFVDGTIGGYYKYVETNPTAGDELILWTIAPANLSYFIDIAAAGLEPAASADVVVGATETKGGSSTVQRFPGDPNGFSRSNTSKIVMKNRTVRHGRALPGKSFILEDDTEKRQFTYQGDLKNLHALLVAHLKMEVKFTHFNGSWEIITPVSEPAG